MSPNPPQCSAIALRGSIARIAARRSARLSNGGAVVLNAISKPAPGWGTTSIGADGFSRAYSSHSETPISTTSKCPV